MKTQLITSLAATAVAGAFAVTLFAAPPGGGDRQGPPRSPDARQGDAERSGPRGPRGMQRRGGLAAHGDRLDHLFERLELSDDQIAAIRSERDDRAEDIRALKDEIVDAKRKLGALHNAMRKAVASHLTDEHKAALQPRGEGRRERGQRRGRGGPRQGPRA